MTLMFRPKDYNKLWLLRERRTGSPWATNVNFEQRSNYQPINWSSHQQQFARRFYRLHYLACHSPNKIQQKYKHVYKNFMDRHFGERGKSSIRFINAHTCHKWM